MLAYKYYTASSPIITSPYQNYINDLQAKINDDWSNASDIFTIQEEQNSGEMDWQDVEVRIGHIIQPSTGDKLGDDWRNIIFKDMSHVYGLGKRYQFDNSVWVTINSDFHRYPTASTIIRRCNNTLNYFVNGVLVHESCIIDYKTKGTSIAFSDIVALQNGRIYVIVQNNSNTQQILENQRFLFNQRAYKVIFVENYLQNYTYDQTSAPFISFYMDINQLNSAVDDVANNIANAYDQNVTQSSNIITPNVDGITQGDSQTYMVYNYDSHGVQTTETFPLQLDISVALYIVLVYQIKDMKCILIQILVCSY